MQIPGRIVRLAAITAIGAWPVLVACDHPQPYTLAEPGPNPVRGGAPRQLTFNPEGDWWPAWLPDGSALGYSYHPLERTDRDRCLAFLPPTGGRILRQICQKGTAESDSVNAVSTHGVSPGGRIALVAESGNPDNLFPQSRNLYLGRLAGGPLVVARPFPYLASTGQVHTSAAGLTWPNESTLVYVAMHYNYRPAIADLPPDTVYTGIELVILRLRGDSVASLTVVPSTLGASSLAPGPPDTVYYTMGGDSRVFELATQTGQVRTVYDFGAMGIARDVQVAGGRMVAIVGGRVAYRFEPGFGFFVQSDSGGPIVTVPLPGGAPTVIASIAGAAAPGTQTFRHLALASSGRWLVAEVSPIRVRHLRFTTDTVVSKLSDLWLFDLP